MIKFKMTPEEKVRGCEGCFFFLSFLTGRCGYGGKLEFGKYGKCLKKRKVKA